MGLPFPFLGLPFWVKDETLQEWLDAIREQVQGFYFEKQPILPRDAELGEGARYGLLVYWPLDEHPPPSMDVVREHLVKFDLEVLEIGASGKAALFELEPQVAGVTVAQVQNELSLIWAASAVYAGPLLKSPEWSKDIAEAEQQKEADVRESLDFWEGVSKHWMKIVIITTVLGLLVVSSVWWFGRRRF